MEEGASMWVPGSPRLSFSRDFVQSEIFKPSTRKDSCSESPDFDFGMLALLRPDDQPPVVPADELIHNGRLLPVGLNKPQHHLPSTQAPPDQRVLLPEQQGEKKSSKPASAPSPSSSSRWKDFLNFRSSGTSSKSSRLRLLFRSSSAGAGRSQEAEPALGRSASESNASSSTNDHLPCSSRVPDIIRSRASSMSWDSSSSSSSACLIDLKQQQQQGIRNKPKVPKSSPQKPRRALAEMKVGSRSMSPGNHQRLNLGNLNQGSLSSNPGAVGASAPAPVKRLSNHGRSSSSADAWRAYSESSRSSSSSSSMKVAEVLHMEVCMGHSLVVSKVAKAFTKKENNHSNKIGVAAG